MQKRVHKRIISVVEDVEEEEIYTGDLNFTNVNEARMIMQKALRLYDHVERAKVANKCTLCNSPATKACAICRTDYCSEECQYKDWPLHQRLCDELAKDSVPQNQNNPPLNQNQPAIMPDLERSLNNKNVNHNFSKRRDPRLQRGFPRGQQMSLPHNSQEPPPQLQSRQNFSRNIQMEPPPQSQNRQNFSRNTQMEPTPQSQNRQNFSRNAQMELLPQSQNRQNFSRNAQMELPPQSQNRQNFSRNLQIKQPINPCSQTERIFPHIPLDIPDNSRQYNKSRIYSRPNPSIIDDNIERLDPGLSNRHEYSREPVQNVSRDMDFQRNFDQECQNVTEANNNTNELFVRRQDPRLARPILLPAVNLPNPDIFIGQPNSHNIDSSFVPHDDVRGDSLPDDRFQGRREPVLENRYAKDTRRDPHVQNPSAGRGRFKNFSGRKTFQDASAGRRDPPFLDNERFPLENRNMHDFPLNNSPVEEPYVENRAPNPSTTTNRRISGSQRGNKRIQGSRQIVNRGMQDSESRLPNSVPESRINLLHSENVRRQDSPMDVEQVQLIDRTETQNDTPKIRVKNFASLKETPAPKPAKKKTTPSLIHTIDQSFSSIFGPANDEAMEGLTDVEDFGDLDDIIMDTGPERVDVIGLTREDNDKYWVVKEINFTLWETMQDDVKKCERNRSIRPAVNIVGACLYDGEWYRGKVIRVRPLMKVHFIDYGNTETYTGEIKELPLELTQVEPLAFLIQFAENTPIKYLTKDLDGRKFEVEIIKKLENDVRLVRIPQKEKIVNKPEVIYTPPNYSKKHPVVLCAYSVNEVYVRPIDENSARNFEKLQRDIDEHVARERSCIYPPPVGEMVCARCDVNETYYRARVIFVVGDLIRVNFVDYGEEQETMLKFLKPISEELKARPDYILKLKLAGVPNSHPPPEVITYYNRLVTSRAKLIMNYEDDTTEGVILEEDATGIVVNDHVTRMILDKIKESELLLEKSLKFISLASGDIKKLVISNVDKEEFYSSEIFYVLDPQHESYDYVNEKLANEIKIYCNKEPTGFTPESKELCLAKFEGEWYRGINLECLQDNEFRIFFIDYGNVSIIHKSCIRRMPKEYSEAPCLAIRATIADSKKLVKKEKLKDDILEYLQSNVSRSIALVEVVEVVEDGLTSLTTLKLPEIDRVLANI